MCNGVRCGTPRQDAEKQRQVRGTSRGQQGGTRHSEDFMTRIEKNSATFRTQDASSIQGSLAEFMKSAVPSDVSKATQLALNEGKFGDDAVAFRMKNGGQAVDMVWDKKSDTMYQLDKGKMTPV